MCVGIVFAVAYYILAVGSFRSPYYFCFAVPLNRDRTASVYCLISQLRSSEVIEAS